MAYQSCKYAPPPELPIDRQMIICTDENGTEWFLTEDSQVGDWLRYVEEDGEITPYEAPEEDEGAA